MESLNAMLGQKVVLDLRSPYVCIGKLIKVENDYFRLDDADLHDLRDSPTTRENYIVSTKFSGVKANRKQVLIRAEEVVAIALLSYVIDNEGDE